MDVSELLESDFVSVQLVQTSPTKKATILNSGVEETGQYGKGCKLLVDIDGKQKYYKPNKTSLKAIVLKWGTKTELWVGKTLLLNLAMLQGGKLGVVASPLELHGGVA